MDSPMDTSGTGEVTPVPAAFRAMVSAVAAATVDHLARSGCSAAGRALRTTSRHNRAAAEAFELAGAFATSAGLASRLAVQAFSCSQEILVRTLESQAELLELLGDAAVTAATTPFRVAASRLS